MGISALQTAVEQVRSDFADIKAAIIEQGVDVPSGTATLEYGNKIRNISGSMKCCEVCFPINSLAYNIRYTNENGKIAIRNLSSNNGFILRVMINTIVSTEGYISGLFSNGGDSFILPNDGSNTILADGTAFCVYSSFGLTISDDAPV